MKQLALTTLLSALALSVATPSLVHADNKQKADALFKQGKKLMGEKRYADACDSFEESYKLDPGIGAQLNIAKCYEEWGKLGRAFTAYQLAQKLANDAKDPRAEKIKELVDNLDTQVPRLTIKIPKDAPKDLTVTLDTKPITSFGDPLVVDPGPHTIEYGVADKKRQKVVPMDRGAENEVSLEITDAMREASDANAASNNNTKPDEPDKPDQPASPPAPGRGMRIGGLALGGAGIVAIGISSVMTLSARGKYNDALEMYCGGMKNNCDPTGLEITRDARSTANTATIIFVAGAAMVGGGIALYLLAPKASSETSDDQARYIVPAITPDSAGIVFGGRY